MSRPYGHGRYQVVERVTIADDEDVAVARELLAGTATDIEGILEAPDPCSYVDELRSGGVVLRTFFWVDNSGPRGGITGRSAFAHETKERFDAADITLGPQPERELSGRLEVSDERND